MIKHIKTHRKSYDRAKSKALLIAHCFLGIAKSEHGNEKATIVIHSLLSLFRDCNTKKEYLLKVKRENVFERFSKVEKSRKNNGQRKRI